MTSRYPGSTYRLQLHSGFSFRHAQALVPYLATLGVTDCYCSPPFAAKPGSTHGYDVARHTAINTELGGEEAFTAFARTLRDHGLGLILDFVPNHMSNDPVTNLWWRDVLENGPSSPFARFFDVDWDPIKPELKERLLLPILGDQYGETLERGLLVLRFRDGLIELAVDDFAIPINPRQAPLVLEYGLDALERELGADHPSVREFFSVLTALRNLPPYTDRDEIRIQERRREKEIARERLARLAAAEPAVRAHIDRAIAAFNGTPGEPRSFDRLHDLLERQPYRLASWRAASDEINYRRFFDINQLAGLRVEDPQVFEHIHQLLRTLVSAGLVTGVRLDHIDGLHDPRAYLTRLRASLTAAGPDGRPPYTIVEKIVSHGESLREDWAADGTTGYTFLNEVNRLFVDARGARRLLRVYARVTGDVLPFADVAYDSKKLIASTALTSEFQVLAQGVNRLSEGDRHSRDFTLGSIGRALREVVACFPVYRTYVSDQGAAAADREAIDTAIAAARRRNPAMESSIFDFLRSCLIPLDSPPQNQQHLDVAMRFQQYTAPVQAKGIEDTAFYRHYALASLNEVGGDPRYPATTLNAFHDANRQRRRRWPGEMLATSTHDTKRGEDARVRIDALSEVPDAWAAAVSEWRQLNAPNRSRLSGGQAPDAGDEYFFYQALIGVWPAAWHDGRPDPLPPAFVERVSSYMHKATKEAKRHTSWITPNDDYENAVARFVERSLGGKTSRAFLDSLAAFLAPVAVAGMINALSQLVIKIGSPGVADFYQGTELWDQSLVDPDNRRPVDFALRQRELERLELLLADRLDPAAHAAAIERLMSEWTSGAIKLYVTARGLALRRRHTALFTEGDYSAVAVAGAAADHVVAFERSHGNRSLVVVAPRLTLTLDREVTRVVRGQSWSDTALRLPTDRPYRNLLTAATSAHKEPPLSELLCSCPVALLWAE